MYIVIIKYNIIFIGIFVSYYYYANYEETENKDYSKAPTTAV
jgi:hypothetical protein